MSNIVFQHWSGTGSMGSLSYGVGADQNNIARFGLDTRFVLVAMRGHFSGGTGDADLTVNLDSGLGPRHDFGLKTLRDIGTDGDELNLRIPMEEYDHWTFDGSKGDKIVPTWTNPNTQTWGIEVLLKPIMEMQDG